MFKIIAGCYEQIVFGYNVHLTRSEQSKAEETVLKWQSQFTDHSQLGCIKCLAANNSIVASGSTDESICLYDLKRGLELGTLQGHEGAVNQVLLPDSNHLISCSDDGNICIWEAGMDGSLLKTLKGHKGPVVSIAVHPSGKLGMSACLKDGTIRTWNMITGRSVYVKNMKKAQIEYIRWSPDGKYYVTASARFVQVYELEKAKCVKEWETSGCILTMKFFPSPNDCVLSIGSDNGNISLYSVPSGVCILNHKAHDNRVKCVHPFIPQSISIPTDEVWSASVSSDGYIKIWKYDLTQYKTKEDSLQKVDCLLSIDTSARLTCVTVWEERDENNDVNETEAVTETVEEKNKSSKKRKRKNKSSDKASLVKKSCQ